MQLILNRLRRREDGFTLIEAVITIAILGIISAALIGVVYQYLKVTSTSRTKLSESTDQQFVSTYWQQDVSSLGRRSFDTANAAFPTSQSVFVGSAGPSGCGAGSGTVVVAFAWTEFAVGAAVPNDAWNATSEEVAYVRVSNGPTSLLKRVRCGSVSGSPITVAHNVVGDPTIACTPSCNPSGGLPETVSMTFTVRDPSEPSSDTSYTTTVTADRRQG